MIKIILDTNVVSELMKPNPVGLLQVWFASLEGVSLLTTAITVSEIVFGLERLPEGSRKTKLQSAFSDFVGPIGPLPILSFDDFAAREAGLLRALRAQQGRSVAFADISIAGIARATNSAIATRNTKDFDGLGLEVINPWVIA
jgi:toxin FitB